MFNFSKAIGNSSPRVWQVQGGRSLWSWSVKGFGSLGEVTELCPATASGSKPPWACAVAWFRWEWSTSCPWVPREPLKYAFSCAKSHLKHSHSPKYIPHKDFYLDYFCKKIFFYWCIVDLQFWVSFSIVKWFSYTYTYIYFFFFFLRFFPI